MVPLQASSRSISNSPRFASICTMSTNGERRPSNLHLRQGGGILQTLATLGSTFGGWLGRLSDSVSPANVRRTRRELRHWVEAHGLTIVLVSVMMVVAWMVAAH